MRHDGRTAADLAPIEVIPPNIARADMHYVATSLIGLPSSAVAAEIALVQYGVMAAHEAQLHFGKTLVRSLGDRRKPPAPTGLARAGRC